MNHAEKDKLLHELKAITLMSIIEIENYCLVHKISIEALKQWYLTTARLPTDREIFYIQLNINIALFLWERNERVNDNVAKYRRLKELLKNNR